MDTILVTGYAKAPQMSVMYEKYKYAGVVLEINVEKNTIVNAEFTVVTSLANNFLKKIVVGYDLNNGTDDLIKQIKCRYVAPSTNSYIVAIKSALRRYEEHRQKNLVNKVHS